jgi:hypothetical protein
LAALAGAEVVSFADDEGENEDSSTADAARKVVVQPLPVVGDGKQLREDEEETDPDSDEGDLEVEFVGLLVLLIKDGEGVVDNAFAESIDVFFERVGDSDDESKNNICCQNPTVSVLEVMRRTELTKEIKTYSRLRLSILQKKPRHPQKVSKTEPSDGAREQAKTTTGKKRR